MEYRNILYYLIIIPFLILSIGGSIIFISNHFEENSRIYFFLIFIIIYIYVSIFIQKKYWSWILKKRKNKFLELLNKKFSNLTYSETDKYIYGEINGHKILFDFNFTNYPPYRFSAPKNNLTLCLNITEYDDNIKEKCRIHFYCETINNGEWIVNSKIARNFFINKSIEKLANNSLKYVGKLIEESENYIDDLKLKSE